MATAAPEPAPEIPPLTDFNDDLLAIASIEAVPTILEVVCRTTGMGFAAVARVTEDRWIACAVRDEIAFGLKPGGELKVETTICDEIRDNRQGVVIDHVAEDCLFRDHHTPRMYGFQSYISMPIILPDGLFFGTLCAIDPRPARVNTAATVGMFKLFAELIAFHLDANQRLKTSEAALLGERQSAELREQFIAVLGHDLRSPLASIDAGMKLLDRTPLNEKAQSITKLIASSTDRMFRLIDDVLDFARGRLGRGIPLKLGDAPVNPALEQVIAEFRTAHPDRIIRTDFPEVPRLRCDPDRIAQLLSNLAANALTHGAPGGPVRVWTATVGGAFELSVSNGGNPIPAETAKDLFRPFFRANASPGQQGLGLGLYIAAEIARAHGGTLSVSSTAERTVFTFRMKPH
jgi:signal transduction histidine kinase